MAGDVNKLQPAAVGGRMYAAEAKAMNDAAAPVVSEKSFDEFHLYTLARPTTLHDQETKQVEFVRSTGIHAQRLYVYDGAQVAQYGYYNVEQIRQDQRYGTQSNPKIWVMEEFKNSELNHLGIALPKGKLRFYRRDTDGHLEFVGENVIDHTPKDETIRVYHRQLHSTWLANASAPATTWIQPETGWMSRSKSEYAITRRNP